MPSTIGNRNRQNICPSAEVNKYAHNWGFPGGSVVKNSPAMQETQEMLFNPWAGKILWRRAQQPMPGFLPGESHGQRSLVGYSP